MSDPLVIILVMARGPKKYNDLQLACAVATHATLSDVLTELGMAPAGGNYETVKRRIRELGFEPHSSLRETPAIKRVHG